MDWRKDLVLLIIVLDFMAIDCKVRTFDCILKYKAPYAGKIAVTKSGWKCQRWDTTCPNTGTGSKPDGDFPEGSKKKAANYCRNPASGGENYPWCYIDDPAAPAGKKWEHCNIPYCTQGTECTISANGREYLGKQDQAKDGATTYICQRWDSQTPQTHTYTKANGEKFNEKTLGEVQNYCRNFDASETRPWCYTTTIRWEYCPAPPICDTANICNAPPTVANAKHTGTAANYNHRDTVTYTCDKGYDFIDEYDGVECLLTKAWTAPPMCVKVKCPTLQIVPRASGKISGDPDRYGTKVTYTCDQGSKRTAGDSERTCQADKTWSGEAPVCTQIICGTPPKVSGASVASTTSTIFGGIARYKCESDQMVYAKTCNMEGEWVGDVCKGDAIGEICSAFDLLSSTSFIGAAVGISGIFFFTVLGFSIAICRLKGAGLSSAAEASGGGAKSAPASSPRKHPTGKSTSSSNQITPERTARYGRY